MIGTVDAAALGAVVTKSMSFEPWRGNPPPRLVPAAGGGMLNSIGLGNPGVCAWRDVGLPSLEAAGVRVIASIWGRTVGEFISVAEIVAEEASRLVAVEVNVSCPNLESAGDMFAHDPVQTAAVIERVVSIVEPLPVWAKLSPNVPSTVPLAIAARDGGADAVVLVNSLIGMRIDTKRRRPFLANVTGGLTGQPLRPVAVRSVYECRGALGAEIGIVGVGGVAKPDHVIEFLMAGADAIEIGSAHLADPRVGVKTLRGLRRALREHGLASVGAAVSVAQ